MPVAKPKPVPTAETEPGFMRLSPPVDPVPSPVRAATDVTTVVEMPSGAVLRFCGLVPVVYLKELLTCGLL